MNIQDQRLHCEHTPDFLSLYAKQLKVAGSVDRKKFVLNVCLKNSNFEAFSKIF